MTRPHWTDYTHGDYQSWSFRIGRLGARVDEMEAGGAMDVRRVYDPNTPKAFVVQMGNGFVRRSHDDFTNGHIGYPTLEEAMIATEAAAIATTHEILNVIEPA